jgi:hypothetical protein
MPPLCAVRSDLAPRCPCWAPSLSRSRLPQPGLWVHWRISPVSPGLASDRFRLVRTTRNQHTPHGRSGCLLAAFHSPYFVTYRFFSKISTSFSSASLPRPISVLALDRGLPHHLRQAGASTLILHDDAITHHSSLPPNARARTPLESASLKPIRRTINTNHRVDISCISRSQTELRPISNSIPRPTLCVTRQFLPTES